MLLNRDRANGMMAEFGIDALLGTTPVNLTYLSDYSPWLQWIYRLYTTDKYQFQDYALVPRDTDTPPALIFQHTAYQAQWPSWIQDLYYFGPLPPIPQEPSPDYPPEVHRLYEIRKIGEAKGVRTAGEALVRALRDRGLTRGVIGADLDGMQPAQLEHVRRELPDLRIKEAGELFRFIRAVKTPEELARLRKVAEINEQGMKELLAIARPGATELDLLAAYRVGVSKAGAQPLFCNNSCGPRAVDQWEPSGYTLKAGDPMYCDAGCIYQHYNADTNVCGVLGEPSRRHLDIFAALSEGLENAIAKVRPGVTCSEVLQAHHAGQLKSGVLKRPTGFGHAVGIEARDMPMIQVPWEEAHDEFLNISMADVRLEAGMVINLEGPYRELGFGTTAREHTIVVTASGCELLTPQPRELWALPA